MAKSVNLDISERVDITCRKGDSLSLIINITDSAAAAIDISSGEYTFKFEVRDTDSSNASFVTGDETIHLSTVAVGANPEYCTATGDASGVLTISAAADKTAGIPSGMYVYDLQATEVGGTSIQTWLHGFFRVNEDVSV